jgi:lipoyl(octanoyl) transferase
LEGWISTAFAGLERILGEWRLIPGLAPYPETLAAMKAPVAAMNEGRAGNAIQLLQHPLLYAAGSG